MKVICDVIETGEMIKEDLILSCLNCGYRIFLEKNSIVPKCKKCGLSRFTK